MEKLFVKFYDLFIVLFCLLVFSILRITVGSSFILYVLIPILGIGAHFGITYFFDVQQARLEASPEYRLLQKQKEDESQLSSCIETLRKLERENDSYYSLIERFLSSVRAFDEKEEALNRLIRLNNDSAKTFLRERISDIKTFIIANARKLAKQITAYDAQDEQNRTESIEDNIIVKAVFTDLNNLTVSYDQLLEEVARMGSDFNPEDPRLCDVVDNLRSLRSTSADDDDDDDVGDGGIRLFVTPTGGQK